MSSTEMQAAVGNNYGQLLITFKNILKRTCHHQTVCARARPKRQGTLTDMFREHLVISKCQW